MGESIAEATLTSWLKEVGDTIELDEAVFEIATDKVDSEVPSEVEGVLLEKLFEVDDVIKVGQTVAIIQTQSEEAPKASPEPEVIVESEEEVHAAVAAVEDSVEQAKKVVTPPVEAQSSTRFYSPLVRNIAHKEGISMTELDALIGTGKEGRVTKNDIMAYLENGRKKSAPAPAPEVKVQTPETEKAPAVPPPAPVEQAPVQQVSAPAPTPTRTVAAGQDEVIKVAQPVPS